MSTWLTAIVMNSSRMINRKRSRHQFLPIDAPKEYENNNLSSELLPDPGPDPEAQFCDSECEHRMSSLVARLPPVFRTVIQMLNVEGRSIRETAEALGLTVGAVKSRAARAREQLRLLHKGKSRRSELSKGQGTLRAREPLRVQTWLVRNSTRCSRQRG
jgi:RNA polymerase sigma-70 factor, ECF subfamily